MTTPALETALSRAVRWLIPALVLTPALLAVPAPGGSIGWVMVHLGAVVIFGLIMTLTLGDLLADPWFTGLELFARSVASAASLVMLPTGAVALITLASSAALRLDPSLQFLQLLSALDITWASATAALGLQMRAGRGAAWLAGSGVVAVCLWSVWRYLDVVGFTPEGAGSSTDLPCGDTYSPTTWPLQWWP
jgi:hypothetical protein